MEKKLTKNDFRLLEIIKDSSNRKKISERYGSSTFSAKIRMLRNIGYLKENRNGVFLTNHGLTKLQENDRAKQN